MKLSIEEFIVTTGWAGSVAGVTAYGLNELPEYIAGLGNSKSLIVKFLSGSENQYIEKTYSPAIDVTNYTELVFHFWSRNKRGYGIDYSLSSDFKYKIDIGGAQEYYVPTLRRFDDITIDISDITSIDKIKITALHDDEDYIIVSHMVAVKDEIPLDMFTSTKEHLDYEFSNFYSKILSGVQDEGILLGTIAGSAGDASVIKEDGFGFLEKYSVIKIKEGSTSEVHQIDHNDESEFYFTSLYDGETLQKTYATGLVYLTFPVEINPREKEITLPGVAVFGMPAEEIIRSNKEDSRRDTFKTNETVKSRIIPSIFKYVILMDGESRHDELIAYLSEVIRKMISKEFIWVNGKKIDVHPEGASTYIEPTEGYNEIPKIQYLMSLEVKEEVFDRQTLVKTITNNLNINIQT